MSKPSIFQHLSLDHHSATPKVQQLSNSIINAIQKGLISKDETLPSLNEMSSEFEISRDTAERSYRYLKEMGVLGSIPGKGYFVKSTEIQQSLKVLLLFNKLSPHKKIIYDSIVSTLNKQAAIDLYIYDNDFFFFKKLLNAKKDGYTHYVIIPHFIEGGEKAFEIINTIDKDKLILLDKLIPGITGQFGAVFEKYDKDIFNALTQALPQLMKYHTLKLIFPLRSYLPQEIIKGFINFCDSYTFTGKIIHQIADERISPGDVFINLVEGYRRQICSPCFLNFGLIGANVIL